MKIGDAIQKPEIIKLAAEAYGITGGSPDKLIRETVEWLTDCYQKTGDVICGEAACQTAKAYSEMERRLKPNVSQVGEALGRWPRSTAKEENVGWIIEDIVHRVKCGVHGCRFYRKGHEGPIFELLVLEEGAWLLDLERKRVYRFEEQEALSFGALQQPEAATDTLGKGNGI